MKPAVDFRCATRRGSILVVVLFVMFSLALMALSFAYRAGLESRTVSSEAVHARLRSQARSATAIAIARLLEDRNDYDHPGELWAQPIDLSNSDWHSDFTTQQTALGGDLAGDFIAHCRVIDEQGKLPLQLASSESLKQLGLTTQQVAALIDWIDEDQVQQAEGGESEYYARLARPHLAADALPADLRDLMMVRGFDWLTYAGEDADGDGVLDPNENDGPISAPLDNANGVLDPGLIGLLNTLDTQQININTVPRVVLETLPLGDAAPLQIIGFRERGIGGDTDRYSFQNVQDIQELQGLSETDISFLSNTAMFSSSDFRIIATAQHRVTGLSYRLETVVHRLEGKITIRSSVGILQ